MGFPSPVNAIKNPADLLNTFIPSAVLIGDLEVDVLLLEVKELSWEITDRKVEAGFDMSTARIKRPVSLRMEGTLTDTPLDPLAIGTSLLSGAGFSFVTADDKKEQFELIADSNELLVITTRLDVYIDMSITNLRVEQTKDNSGAYPFVLETRNFKIFSSSVTDIDPSQIPKNLREKEEEKHKKGSGKKKPTDNQGQKVAEDATKKDEDPLRTLARGLGFDV